MTFFQNPTFYEKISLHIDLVENVYAAMKGGQGDLAELVLTTLDVLKKIDLVPKFEQKRKSIQKSDEFREEGNKAYTAGKYQTALKYYNQALSHAPSHTKCMILAYSNRSALFHKTKNFTASLRDIDVCLKLKCSSDILDKLTRRRADCTQNLFQEMSRYGSFTRAFFSLEGKQHPQIPCITNDVKVSIDPYTQLPKITAAKDIKIGTVVAVEKAFTTLLTPLNYYLCCYYCHKMSLNLMPCPDCTYVLFCDCKCQNLCLKENHSIECKIMELLHGGFCGPYSRITFKTVVKTKLMCSSWKEFIEASHMMGSERVRNSTLEQIFDGTYKFSMLTFVELKDIKIGAMYNFAIMCATFVHELSKQVCFMPFKAEEKEEAIKALARMSLGLFLKFYNKIELKDIYDDRMAGMLSPTVPNNGYFAFASKLRHACESNLTAVGLNDRVALVAVQPIKKGTELTICYVNHAYDMIYSPVPVCLRQRALQLYRFAQVCRCQFCVGTFKAIKSIDDVQKKQYRRWLTQNRDHLIIGEPVYKSTCDVLTSLHGLLGTKEHQAVYAKFVNILYIYQLLETKNAGPSERMICF